MPSKLSGNMLVQRDIADCASTAAAAIVFATLYIVLGPQSVEAVARRLAWLDDLDFEKEERKHE